MKLGDEACEEPQGIVALGIRAAQPVATFLNFVAFRRVTGKTHRHENRVELGVRVFFCENRANDANDGRRDRCHDAKRSRSRKSEQRSKVLVVRGFECSDVGVFGVKKANKSRRGCSRVTGM